MVVDSASEKIIGFRPRVFKGSEQKKTAGADFLAGRMERR